MAEKEKVEERDQGQVYSLINHISDQMDNIYFELFRLAIEGLEYTGKTKELVFLELFEIIQRGLGSLSLAVSFTCHVFKTFGGHHYISQLEQYQSTDFKMAAYSGADLRLTVAAFFFNLDTRHQLQPALAYISNNYLNRYNYSNVSICQFVSVMCNRGVISVGNVSSLEHLAKTYNCPNFFDEYLQRSSDSN